MAVEVPSCSRSSLLRRYAAPRRRPGTLMRVPFSSVPFRLPASATCRGNSGVSTKDSGVRARSLRVARSSCY